LAFLPTNRLAPLTIEADRATVLALQDMHDYQPRNPAYNFEALTALEVALTQAEQAERRARIALDAARDQAIAAAHALHDATLGAKAEVIAQYGADSPAVQAIGLKRKSERRRPTRRAGASAGSGQ
jgi:hypothetical protein